MSAKKENVIKEKSFDFALRIISLYKFLCSKNEYILSKQLLRSGTSIGANVREAEHAQSKRDFLNKMNIALKEANETDYWIDLLYKSDYISEAEFNSIKRDCVEVLKLLISIVKSLKQK